MQMLSHPPGETVYEVALEFYSIFSKKRNANVNSPDFCVE
jgi:hypothetical protein